jgi:hypothetical protein
MRAIFKNVFILVTTTNLLSCGVLNKDSGNSGAAANTSQNKVDTEGGLQLKNALLLSQTVESAFGSGKDLIENPAQAGRNSDAKSSCFEVYKHTLGSEQNLRFGEIFADSPSTQYFMSLSICASKVASACKTDISQTGINSKCDCSTREKTKALLQRAIPQTNFSDSAQAELVEKVFTGCKTDYKGTISAIISSLAFAQR